jgi:fibrillarin-like pre-rRNA processing protein
MVEEHRRLKGVYFGKRKLYTKNLVPGKSVYGENLVQENGVEYREWDPKRSKLGSAIAKEVSQIGIKEDDVVLYLGCSTGTTTSHVSDIVGKNGFVFALDFSPRVMRELVFLAEKRKNIAPIVGDARNPKTYEKNITEVDAIFQDVAQRDQAEIFLKNCDSFLKKGGFGLLAIKARSIDVTRNPSQIFAEVRKKLEQAIIIVDYRTLEPFEKDHCIFVCKKK